MHISSAYEWILYSQYTGLRCRECAKFKVLMILYYMEAEKSYPHPNAVRNAIKFLGFEYKDITCEEDILQSEAIIFPGQGSFKQAINV